MSLTREQITEIVNACAVSTRPMLRDMVSRSVMYRVILDLLPSLLEKYEQENAPTSEAAARDMQQRAAEVVREQLGGHAGDSLADDILALPLNQQGKD